MRLLYIVPKIKESGGVARVLSVKSNYFVEHFGYEVHILSQNEHDVLPFYSFNEKILFHDMNLEGSVFNFIINFYKSVNHKIKEIKPDVILVADNGLKAFTYPFILDGKIPILFECHGSKFIEEKVINNNFLLNLKYKLKNFGASKFTKMICLSNESVKEWSVENAIVIPNPSWIVSENTASLQSKKAIVVARNSYEKGLDRLLLIWKIIILKHPDWTLDVYTNDISSLEKQAVELKLFSNINYHNFVKNIENKYLESSLYIMTSRTEGFPMVLLEAMTLGLPCVAFDCPSGLNSIIKNGKNGFLIPDDNIDLFAKKIFFLIENDKERFKFGTNAKEVMKDFSVDKIMQQWQQLLETLKTS